MAPNIPEKQLEIEVLKVYLESKTEVVGWSKIAKYIKLRFDESHGPVWHCVVGKHFNACVTYEKSDYIFLELGGTGILLFRCLNSCTP